MEKYDGMIMIDTIENGTYHAQYSKKRNKIGGVGLPGMEYDIHTGYPPWVTWSVG